MTELKSLLDWEPPDMTAIEVNAEYAKNFDTRPAPTEGMLWWFRPVYFRSSCCPITYEWECAFCSHHENNSFNYGKKGYKCPQCGAEFVGEDSFGTWMAKEVDEQWANSLTEAEFWM